MSTIKKEENSTEKNVLPAVKNFAEMETQNYFDCQDSNPCSDLLIAPNEQHSLEHQESLTKKKRGRKGRKRLSSLVTPPDSGSCGRGLCSQPKSSQSPSIIYSSQSSQHAGHFLFSRVVATSPPSTHGWSQGPFTRRQKRITRNAQKQDMKEQVSNLVDCVKAVRQVVRVWVIEGGNPNTTPSQIVKDISNIQQKAQQLLKQFETSQELQHVLQACESMSFQMRYVSRRHKSLTSSTGSQLQKKQLQVKQEALRKADQNPSDLTCGLPSLMDLIDVGLLEPGKSSLCLFLEQCLPVKATINLESNIQSPNGVVYKSVEDWCKGWSRDAVVSRADAYEFTFFEGASLLYHCSEIPELCKKVEKKKKSSQEGKKTTQVAKIKYKSTLEDSKPILKSEARKPENDKTLPVKPITKLLPSSPPIEKEKEEECTSTMYENHRISSDEETYFSEPDIPMSPMSKHEEVLEETKLENATSVSPLESSASKPIPETNIKISPSVLNPRKAENSNIPQSLQSEKLNKNIEEKRVSLLKNINRNKCETNVELNSENNRMPLGIFKISSIKFANDSLHTNTNMINNKSSAAEVDFKLDKPKISENEMKIIPEDTTVNKENSTETVKSSNLKESKNNSTLKNLNKDESINTETVQIKSASKVTSPDLNKEKIKIKLSPSEISKLKARSQNIVNKLDNEIHIPDVNILNESETQTSKCGVKDNNILKHTNETVNSLWDNQKPIDQMTEEEQEEWRIRMKAKMLAKWNADVQAWGNVEPSPVREINNSNNCLQTIPRYVPEYKNTEHNCSIQSHESTIQALEQLAVMMKNVQDMVSQLSSSNSVTSIDKRNTPSSQKFNTPSSQSQHYASPLSTPKPFISERYSQSEELLIENSQEGSQRTYPRAPSFKTSHPRFYQRLSCSQNSTDNFQSLNSQKNVLISEALIPCKSNQGVLGNSTRKTTPRATTSGGGFNRKTPSKVSFQTSSTVLPTPKKTNSQPWL